MCFRFAKFTLQIRLRSLMNLSEPEVMFIALHYIQFRIFRYGVVPVVRPDTSNRQNKRLLFLLRSTFLMI